MSRILLLYARRWDFPDKATGERVIGAKFVYVSGYPVASTDELGEMPAEEMVRGDVSLFQACYKGPGVYEAEYGTRADPKTRKPVQTLTALRFVAPVDIGELIGQAAAAEPLRRVSGG